MFMNLITTRGGAVRLFKYDVAVSTPHLYLDIHYPYLFIHNLAFT